MDKIIQNKLDDNFNLFFPKHTETTQSRVISVKNADKTLVNKDLLNTCASRPNHHILGE